MLLLTPHERRAIIFISVAFFCGICLDIVFKANPPSYARLRVLDAPLSCLKVDVNRAGYAELLAVPGIGPSTAARIIYAREGRRGFSSLEQLRAVKGMSRKNFERAAACLTLGAP
jgi:competence ComEA-like helix-hairpin-helix protein